MKIYDKEMYKKQESFRNYAIIIIVFLIGFFAGYMAHSLGISEAENNNNNTVQVVNQK